MSDGAIRKLGFHVMIEETTMNPRDKFAASKTFDEAIEAVEKRFDYSDYVRLTEEGGATCVHDSVPQFLPMLQASSSPIIIPRAT